MDFLGIDHVQLAAPPGCEADARRFFGEVLGLRELPKPAAHAVRGGLWFQCGGQQIHIGVEEDFRPAKKAHPALRLRDEAAIEAVKARLKAADIVTRDDNEIEDAAGFFADDPWGNRLEFVTAKSPATLPHGECVDAQYVPNAERLLDLLNPRNDLWGGEPSDWIYRGHANASWQLKASAFRDLPKKPPFANFARCGIQRGSRHAGWVPDEVPRWPERRALVERMLEQFRLGLDRSGLAIPSRTPRVNPDEFNEKGSNMEPEREAFPLMALAQHNGLPTFLLDWTRRALVAAYFAAVEAADPDHGGSATHLAVWALMRADLIDPTEGPFFYDAPAGMNPNLYAQSGLFTMHLAEDEPSLEELCARTRNLTGGSLPLRRIMLPVSEAPKLLRLLSQEGINGASMFPGADGVVRGMREKALWDDWRSVVVGERLKRAR
jgi:hypothetical protein